MPAPSLAERFAQWRASLVADPRFQRWAPRLPLVRAVARRRTRALFDLTAGFVYSQILFACVQLDVFARLAKGARPATEIAAEIGLPEEPARRLLKAAVALNLLRAWPGDRFGLDDLGSAVLGNPGVAAMVKHHALLYADLADPIALLKRGGGEALPDFWTYAADSDADAYSELMALSQTLVADDVIDSCDFFGRTRLMDVGGGEGVFLRAVTRRAPSLKLTLFDLPPVVARARAANERAGLGERIETRPGDFLNDELPPGADVISLVRVLHDHEDVHANRLLQRAFAALPPRGALLIAEPMAEVPGEERVGHAYFGLYLLAMGRGRPRSQAEIIAMLRSAGFAEISKLKTPRPSVASALWAVRA